MNERRWVYRKRVIYLTLFYCLGLVAWLTFQGIGESELHSDVAGSLILLAAVTLGGYVFGRTIDSEETSLGEDTELGTWEERRRMIFTALFLCAGGVLFLTIKGEDTSLNSTIANGLCLLAGSVISSYLFGAIFDDSKLRGKQNPPAIKEKW